MKKKKIIKGKEWFDLDENEITKLEFIFNNTYILGDTVRFGLPTGIPFEYISGFVWDSRIFSATRGVAFIHDRRTVLMVSDKDNLHRCRLVLTEKFINPEMDGKYILELIDKKLKELNDVD